MGHTNIVSNDVSIKVDSVDPAGVRWCPIARDRHQALVFRFRDPDIAQRAGLLARSWAPTEEEGRTIVGYSGGSVGVGITFRVVAHQYNCSNISGGYRHAFGSRQSARAEETALR